jgi:uncharacterized repeat protein (TIGR04076 family)
MSQEYEVKVKVVSQTGRCAAGHKVGDEWTIWKKSDGGLCLEALHAIHTPAQILATGGGITYHTDNPYVTRVACPDADNLVVFELSRGRTRTIDE